MKSKQKAKAKKAKTAKKAVKTMCRIEASVIALGKIPPKGKIAYHSAEQRADNIYAGQPSGGKSNMKEQAQSFRRVAKVLVLLGLIKVEEGTITRLK